MKAASTEHAVAVVNCQIVEEGLPIAPPLFDEHLHAFKQCFQAVRKEPVKVIEGRRTVAGIKCASRVQTQAAGLKDSHHLSGCEPRFGEMFQDLMRVNQVEAVV